MIQFELNADLRQVWLRLAGQFNAGMAELERPFRTGEYTGENPVTGSILQQEDNDANTD